MFAGLWVYSPSRTGAVTLFAVVAADVGLQHDQKNTNHMDEHCMEIRHTTTGDRGTFEH